MYNRLFRYAYLHKTTSYTQLHNADSYEIPLISIFIKAIAVICWNVCNKNADFLLNSI